MQFRLTIGKAILLSALSLASFGAQAQDLPANTVATVNGMAITYDDISLAEDELIGLVGQLPERQRFETLVGYMVDRILAAEAARNAGLENTPEVAKRIDFMKQKALQDVFVGQKLMQRVSEERVASYYQDNIVDGPKQEEVREVREGFECGMGFENYQDIQVGDVIECFEVEEVARAL